MDYQEEIKNEMIKVESIGLYDIPANTATLIIIAAELRKLNDNIQKLAKRVQSDII